MIAVGPPDRYGVRLVLDGGQATPITIEPFSHGQFAVCEQRSYRSAHQDLQAALAAAIILHEARLSGQTHNGGSINLRGDPLSHQDNTRKLREAKGTPEADFQRRVIELAQAMGWMVVAFRPAQMRSGKWATPVQGHKGSPDLLLARDGVVWLWELKSDKGRQNEEQRAWAEAIGSSYRLLRPDDWDTIVRLLGGETGECGEDEIGI